MKRISLEDVKKIQLDILQDVANFCENSGLSYFLAYGTLIGAIRHNGYIPWDDDIDIAMPRQDYDIFVNEYNKKESNFKVIDVAIDKDYGIPFAKVYDKRTWLDEFKYRKEHYGVFIDIFPIDGVKDEKQIQKIRTFNLLLHTKKANFKQRKVSKIIAFIFLKILLLPFSVHSIVKVIDKMSRKYPYGSTPMSGSICDTVVGERAMIETPTFEGYIMHEFEGNKYRIPQGFDNWLRRIYGDYMQLPPENKRVGHHDFIAYWKD